MIDNNKRQIDINIRITTKKILSKTNIYKYLATDKKKQECNQ